MKALLVATGVIVTISVLALPLFYGGIYIWGEWYDEWSGYNASASVSDGVCNIAVIRIVGDITTFEVGEDEINMTNADDVVSQLRAAENDPFIHGVLVTVDSYGGYPAASEIIADAFRNSSLPVIALIREAGTSGAYLIASGAHKVVASPFSDVGGIGISMSYLENTSQNESAGLSYVELTSAPYKDYGSPDKPLTAAEREILERDLEYLHNHFVELVAEYRGLPVEEVMKLADGASVPGEIALEQGLIDKLGGKNVIHPEMGHASGLWPKDIVYCE